MRAWLVLVVACSGSTPEPRPPPIVAARPPVAAPRPAPPPAPPTVPTRPAQVAAPGHALQLLAMTDDGTAVVTADFNRTIRLWPTLDGTREPIVVTGPVPAALAIAHDGDGFAIAIQDLGGTLRIERLTRDGGQLPERMIESPLPYEQLEATRTGFIALRADDTVEAIAPDGSRRSIAPPPARIGRLVVRGDGVLALVNGHGHLLVDGRWGEATPPLPIDPAHAVLAPDKRHVAGKVGPTGPVVEIDLATGKRTPAGSSEATPLGYVDATTLATTFEGGIAWRGRPAHPSPSPVSFGELTTAVGDAHVVAGVGVQLAIVAPGGTQFLGYDVVDPAPLHATSIGLLARADLPELVDEQLTVRPLFAKAHEGDWMDYTMLDEHHGAALVRDFTEDMERRWVEIIDPATGKRLQKLPADARLDTLVWEPATQLFATLSIEGGELYHFEGGKLVPTAKSLPGAPDRVFLLDPALANGDIAIVVESGRASRLDAKLKPHDPIVLGDSLLAIDRAGRMIWRHGADLVIGDAHVPGLGHFTVRVSPDLKRVAAFSAQKIVLIDRDGSIRWSVIAWGTRDLGWTPDNELVASLGGLVRLDLATGQRVARRCGWAFGLSATAHAGAAIGTSACDD